MKKSLLLILIIGLLSVLIIGCGTDNNDPEADQEVDQEVDEEVDEAAAEEEQEEPELAPDLKYENSDGEIVALKNLSGQEVSLEDYRGKIIFLNFWATWCGYCDAEMPDLQRLDDENEDLVVIAVDVMEEQSLVEEYIEEGGYDFEVALDLEGGVAQNYYVSAFPTTYVIREDGSVSRYFNGMMTYEIMEDLLKIAREGT